MTAETPEGRAPEATAGRIADLCAEWRRLIEARSQEGPLSWGYIGEKTNGFVIGWACKEDGTPVSGKLDDSEDMVDRLIYRGQLGEHEAATCNYADPEFIVFAWNHAEEILAALEGTPPQ